MRRLIAAILKWQAKRLLAEWEPIVVVITGSVGKTSTTQAIGTMLEATKRIRVTRHNYNSDVSVPCSIFGQDLPERLFNPFAWIGLMLRNEKVIHGKQAFDTLVLELGTDHPGEIADFAYLQPHIAVVTAVAPEHMEFFKTMDAVAAEELSVAEFSKETVCNKHLVSEKYLGIKDINWYSTDILKKYKTKPLMLGEQGKQIAAAAVWVGERLGIGSAAIEEGLSRLGPQPGRMQMLKGIEDSIIIDDTYNASPEAALAALNFLYSHKAPARIALLGNMNELGDVSPEEHARVGKACDPAKLDLVITLGKDANESLAASAEKNGCKVVRVASPYQAADVIRAELRRINKKAVLVLCKGSQNGVFAEEAVKILLANKADAAKLVRQSSFWMSKKKKSFSKAAIL